MKIISTMFKPNDTFYIGSYGYEDISEKAHWGKGRRNMCYIHYVVEGEGSFNNQKVDCGNGFLILPDELHEYHSSTERPWKYFWIAFGGVKAVEICKKYIHTDKNHIFKFDFKPKLLNLCDNIFSETSTLSEAKSLSYLFMLMSYHETKRSFDGHLYVEESKRYMDMHFYRNISISEVAEFIGVNDRYLYNLFIKYEKISPKKYLTDLRINRAKSMLTNTGASISEVAVSCGFADVLAFSRFFSKNTGKSPTAYRNNFKD